MSWFKAGLVAVTNNLSAVVGTGTSWVAAGIKPGDIFFRSADKTDFYEIASIQDDTHLTLASPYTGATLIAQAYSIISNFTNTDNAMLTAQIAQLVSNMTVRDTQMAAWAVGTINGGPGADGYYPITGSDGVSYLVPCPALIDPTTASSYDLGVSKLLKVPVAGSTQTLNLANSSAFHLVLNLATCAVSFTNWNTNAQLVQTITLILEQAIDGAEVTFPINVRWNQQRPPKLSVTSGYKDFVELMSFDGGLTWVGFFFGVAVL